MLKPTLHKLRVTLRRMRTLLWAYRPILDEKFDNEQRALFKSLANAAGNTRDWDMLISFLRKGNISALLDALKKIRNEAAKKSEELTDRHRQRGSHGRAPTTVITARIDPLRSDGEKLAENLSDARANVITRNYQGVTHEFFGMATVVGAAREAQEFVVDTLRPYLEERAAV